MWPLLALGAVALGTTGYVLKKPSSAISEETRLAQLKEDFAAGRLTSEQYLKAVNDPVGSNFGGTGKPDYIQLALLLGLVVGGAYLVKTLKE